MDSMMIMTIPEARQMAEFDKIVIEKKIRKVNEYLKGSPTDKVALKKLNRLQEDMNITNEYIEHYKHVETLLPIESREFNLNFARALRGA